MKLWHQECDTSVSVSEPGVNSFCHRCIKAEPVNINIFVCNQHLQVTKLWEIFQMTFLFLYLLLLTAVGYTPPIPRIQELKSASQPLPHVGQKYLELFVVADKDMVDFHGDNTGDYVFSLMNIVSDLTYILKNMFFLIFFYIFFLVRKKVRWKDISPLGLVIFHDTYHN